MSLLLPTADRVRELFHYDIETGVFTRRASTRRRPAGAVVGSLNTNGYLAVNVDGRRCLLHQLAWLYVYGVLPALQIDHRDTVKTNNAISNLREVTGSHNSQNLRAAHRDSRTGVLGVSFHGKAFAARITIEGKKRHLGCFPTAELAHAAYVQAKRKYHPGTTL